MVIAGVVVVELSMIILSSRYNAVVLARESVNKRKVESWSFFSLPFSLFITIQVKYVWHDTVA